MEGETRYYIAQGENVQGPFPRSKVVDLIRQGRARPDMLYSAEGGPWIVGHEVADLFPGGAAGPGPAPLYDEPEWEDQPAAPVHGRGRGRHRLKAHRGGAVLALGILGLVVCFICGIFAWVMGADDLKQMRQGRMDPSGQGMTQAGMICGIIGTILAAIGLLIFLLVGVGSVAAFR
ncbi:MAG: hypothetical protein ACYTG6_10560 [Planctomycetota bacterium]|jgi:hypothetical protein